jgi:hypothetical protein
MTSISSLIDFLMGLMRDDNTKREFAADPDSMMAEKGLSGVTAQDVRDARLIMADDGGARPRPDAGSHDGGYGGGHGGGYGGGSDAVREIVHTTNTFEIDQSRHTTIGDIDQTIVNIDDRDTTILDSFNSADEVTAIQDNDTINNNDNDTDVDVVNIEDSFNDEPGEVTIQPVEVDEPIGDPAAVPGEGEVSIQPVEDEPVEDEPVEDVLIEPEPEPDPVVSIQPVEDEEPGFVDIPVA